LFAYAQEFSMPDNKHKSRPHGPEVELWARALGVSPQRLIALVEEVANERLFPALGLWAAKVPSKQQSRARSTKRACGWRDGSLEAGPDWTDPIPSEEAWKS
jgi:hypothetical protein